MRLTRGGKQNAKGAGQEMGGPDKEKLVPPAEGTAVPNGEETAVPKAAEPGPVTEEDRTRSEEGKSAGEGGQEETALAQEDGQRRPDESSLRSQLEAVQAELKSALDQAKEFEERAASLQAERDEWAEKAKIAYEQFLRARSDLDGFRKRTERDLEDRINRGKADLILALLEVLDNFDRALEAAQKTGSAQAEGVQGAYASADSSASGQALQSFIRGVQMIRRQFFETLAREGVEEIPSPVGKPMDPSLHDAVAAQEGGGEHGTVVAELRKGYLYKGMVLRPTRVKVIR
ncbi:MAG TPA: nucleotide exchange factor GrpE [Firmicutes bacterium]|nr:nucleotide exchange factor GrpE [Candidatus Fermentithermobacillaceae bacterium]